MVRLTLPATEGLDLLELTFSLRPQARENATLDVVLNGALVKNYRITGRTTWVGQKLTLAPKTGVNVLEFRNVTVGTEPDWLDYLERNPDVKAYVVSQNIPLEQGAQAHYETHGKHENRVLNRPGVLDSEGLQL